MEIAIAELKENLENADEGFWQRYFQKNVWILQQIFPYPVIWISGETYLGGKNSKGRQGQGGVATDFLFMNSSNGSFAVVELKTPMAGLVGARYRGVPVASGTNVVHAMHSDLTGALVQMENQILTAQDGFNT